MNRFLKWVLAGLGVVVVFLVVTALVLPRVIDPNNYKEKIRTAVRQETGRELTIGGEIKWTVFPSIGLDFSELSLSNRSGFGDQPMLIIDGAAVSVKLIPLFSKKLDVGVVNLAGVTANLRQKADGQNNWEDLTGPRSDVVVSPPGSAEDLDIQISGGNITLSKTDQTAKVKGFEVAASEIALSQSFDLKGGFSVNLPQQDLAGNARLDGLVQVVANGRRVAIEGLDFNFKGEHGHGGEGIPLDMSANTDVAIDFTRDQATLSDLVFRFFNLALNGELSVTSLSATPEFAGQLTVAEFSPKSLMKALGVDVPPTNNDQALTSMRADMRINGSASQINMKDLVVKLDQSTFRGNLKAEDPGHPRLAFDFVVDSLNLDDYSTVTSEQSGANTDSSGSPAGALFGFNGGGDFRVGKLVLGGLTATDVSLTLTGNDNGIRLFPITASLYGGQHEGDINIKISGNQPILTANHTLTGIQAEGLSRDLTGASRLQGTGDFYLDVRTDLGNPGSALQDLSGTFGISFVDGAIIGFNVAGSLRTAKTLLGKQTEAEAVAGDRPKTDFSELTATGTIEKGIVRSDDLMMLSPLLRVTGKGAINLVDETINYIIEPVLVGSLEGQGGEGLESLKGVPIPVRLTGNLYEPDIAVDPIAALSGSQKTLINQKKDELAKSLFDKVFDSNKDRNKKNGEKDDDGGN